ncbi:hypothetical protein QKU48_gp0153 [Fadolivirus algeromassiliense]|jgi:hypothetical protein|uniref:Uncharacterized protein n=1 Tax=Fadolivirus FV1/VV64 TaxID=3070911 RepID=A0A7D3UTM7_9VIRU|nr:hypothetical protein QKU48_gp0153 [Fadolivirus algeromassiliense]QKF93611.1 hypothetical protein Fadolivirus_1_153 [Fadolivirus FV1/VV64]
MSFVSSVISSLANHPGFYAKVGTAGCFFLFMWEHVARTKGSNVKPSVGIAWTADKLKVGFYQIGVGFSKLSSFLTYIKLGDLYQTAQDLFKPTIELFGSPLQSLKGYWDTALTYSYPVTVTLGSATLVGVFAYLWFIVGHRLPVLQFWPISKLPLKYA